MLTGTIPSNLMWYSNVGVDSEDSTSTDLSFDGVKLSDTGKLQYAESVAAIFEPDGGTWSDEKTTYKIIKETVTNSTKASHFILPSKTISKSSVGFAGWTFKSQIIDTTTTEVPEQIGIYKITPK